MSQRTVGRGKLDLFAAAGALPEPHPRPDIQRPELAAAELDDAALIAAIPGAGMMEAPAFAAEAGRRGLVTAVPALEQLCRRLAGYGLERLLPEQVAALEALAVIGGRQAAQAVARLIAGQAVQGPTLRIALGAAARLNTILPVETVGRLLRHADPEVRANACRCTGGRQALAPVALDLTSDPDAKVSVAAWCALGRMGRPEARPMLTRLLRAAPSSEAIEAVSLIADEDCIILLGRIARTRPDLADGALAALETIDQPRARHVAASLAAGAAVPRAATATGKPEP